MTRTSNLKDDGIRQKKPIIYKNGSCKIKTVGGDPDNDNYGAWPVCTNLLPPNPLVYSFGVGVDISFDLAMVHDFNASVFCYDPTISNESFALLNKEHNTNISFLQIGAGPSNEVIHFYKSNNPIIQSLVSTPGLKGYGANPHLTAAVHDILSITAMNQHTWVDLVKLDVEGKEFDIFLQNTDNLHLLPSLPTSQVLVEFHARLFEGGREKQVEVYRRFMEAGWELTYEDPKRLEEAIFVRVAE